MTAVTEDHGWKLTNARLKLCDVRTCHAEGFEAADGVQTEACAREFAEEVRRHPEAGARGAQGPCRPCRPCSPHSCSLSTNSQATRLRIPSGGWQGDRAVAGSSHAVAGLEVHTMPLRWRPLWQAEMEAQAAAALKAREQAVGTLGKEHAAALAAQACGWAWWAGSREAAACLLSMHGASRRAAVFPLRCLSCCARSPRGRLRWALWCRWHPSYCDRLLVTPACTTL